MITFLTQSYDVWPVPGDRPVEFDLGCGSGGFLVGLADAFPERFILGADVMLGRLRKVERLLREGGHDNAALLRASAWNLVGLQLPDASLDRVHILCPDPWPKARHACRRLCSSEFLGRLAAKIKPGGVLHLATDQAPYIDFMQAAIAPLDAYTPEPEAIADVAAIKTDFERGFEAEGLAVTHLGFRRR